MLEQDRIEIPLKTGFTAFVYREYRYYWVAAAFSNVGMWALVYGRLWLMHDLTQSTVMVGLVTTSTLAPVLLLSMWGGVIADRVNRLYLVRATRGLFIVLATLTGILIKSGVIAPWQLIAISIVTGVLLSFDIPSRAAMVPALVPKKHLPSAIALYSFVFGGASIVGPIIFAPLVSLWGLEALFFLIALMYLMTVIALGFMSPERHQSNEAGQGMVRGLLDGFLYLRRERTIAGLIILGIAIGVFGSSFETLLPHLADEVHGGAERMYGRFLLSGGIGGLMATSFIALMGPRAIPSRFLIVGGAGYGIALITLSQITWLNGALITVGAMGAFRVIFGIMNTTLVQTLTADQYRGRVMSMNQFTWGATALGSVSTGALAQTLGFSTTLALSGAMVAASTLAIAILFIKRPIHKNLQGY